MVKSVQRNEIQIRVKTKIQIARVRYKSVPNYNGVFVKSIRGSNLIGKTFQPSNCYMWYSKINNNHKTRIKIGRVLDQYGIPLKIVCGIPKSTKTRKLVY